MTRRVLSTILLLSFIITLTGSAQARDPISGDENALIYIEVRSPADIERFEATGLAAYARLQGRQPQDYLLSGADAAGHTLLSKVGLTYHILDADMRGASYYLAYPMPGRSIEWEDYGQLLLDDGVQALLRTTPAQAESLAQAGAELRALTFDPKPLQPVSPPLSIPSVIDPDPLIQTMINQVYSSTVYTYTGGLTGDWPVWVDGDWYTITTRNTYSGEPIQKATHWAGEHLADLGLGVEYHQWDDPTNPNVIGELPGLVNPEDIFIIGGHLDDVNGTPGADDNASGSVAALIAADILSQYQWGCTLRFALWTGEEQGLWGSHYYALRSYQQGENIVGYLNLDMISYNTIGSSPDIDLIYNPNMPPTQDLAQLFDDVVDAYNLLLFPQLITSLGGGSDHQSFWDYGYTAILGIEDQGDFNPEYHGPGDTLENQNLFYYTQFVKGAVGTMAHMANCLIPEYNVDLSGDEAMTGIPGETITYTLSVTHTGNAPMDTFDISLGESSFPASADVSVVGPQASGESANFHVMVEIPDSALPGEMDTVDVTVTSQGDNTKTDSATLTTSVGGSYGVMMSTGQSQGSGTAGATVTYTVQLTNTGSLQDTLVLTYHDLDPGWTVQLMQQDFQLAGGESAGTSFQITIPPTALEGDWDAFMLQAKSWHDPSKWNEIQFTTTVSETCSPPESVDFVWSPFDPWAGDEMTFVASASGSEPMTYNWDFDDGAISQGKQVLHTYDSGGVYTVTLKASNTCGQTSTSQNLTVASFLYAYLPVISNTRP